MKRSQIGRSVLYYNYLIKEVIVNPFNSVFPEDSELGKKAIYDPHYNPDVLFALPRKSKRDEIGINGALPFVGFDLWNHYEVSWLNEKGKPIAAIAEIIYPCESEHIIESKSMKLYFNSLNNTVFKDIYTLQSIIIKDLSARVGLPVAVNLIDLIDAKPQQLQSSLRGVCLDSLDIACSIYTVQADFLSVESDGLVEEALYSNLLKSNCLVTNQPDWASIEISYKGRKMNHEGLLKYLVSFRNHNEFHEQCIERIFVDIMSKCKPEQLAVYGRYTRRGGLDINAYRGTTHLESSLVNVRHIRQ